MRNIQHKIKWIAGMIAFMWLSSCSEHDCSMSGRPSVRFNFVDKATGQPVATDSLTVTAYDTDSILINRQKTVKHLSLPMNYVAEETVFILKYNAVYSDTIWIEHSNTPHFISMECGKEMFFHVNKFRHTKVVMDSISLSNPDISKDEKENFKIYFTVSD